MNASLAALRNAGALRRVDAALGEWLARAFPDAPAEAALAAALAARAIAAGHSALALDAAQAFVDGLADTRSARLPAPDAWREALRDASAVHVAGDDDEALLPLVLDAQGRVYLRRYHDYERELADALIACARAASPHPRTADGSPPPPPAGKGWGGGHDALAHRLTLVTGGPGTGKTHGVARMLLALAQAAQARGTSLRIALAAPTGKAAARLSEALRAQLAGLDLDPALAAMLPRSAGTLHRLLGLSPWRVGARFDRAAPLPHDVVVVDEVSMVDLPLMAKLVAAIPAHAHLILLGDPEQLSAVEAGNVLGALVDAAQEPPLRDCHVALTHSHRFGADSTLGMLARAISGGDAEAALAACTRGAEVRLVAAQAAQDLDALAEAYRPLLTAADPAAALRAARGFRVLTALRHGPAGCIALDAAIAARLQGLSGARADPRGWRGRLLMITANRHELGLFNGDSGVVWPDADGVPRAWFEDADGAPRALPLAALPPHEGAFALTVHKAQGSEFERVALVTGVDSPALTRELLYTGVTRARRALDIHASADVLRAGIERRSLRMTGLADRLREAAAAAP